MFFCVCVSLFWTKVFSHGQTALKLFLAGQQLQYPVEDSNKKLAKTLKLGNLIFLRISFEGKLISIVENSALLLATVIHLRTGSKLMSYIVSCLYKNNMDIVYRCRNSAEL